MFSLFQIYPSIGHDIESSPVYKHYYQTITNYLKECFITNISWTHQGRTTPNGIFVRESPTLILSPDCYFIAGEFWIHLYVSSWPSSERLFFKVSHAVGPVTPRIAACYQRYSMQIANWLRHSMDSEAELSGFVTIVADRVMLQRLRSSFTKWITAHISIIM